MEKTKKNNSSSINETEDSFDDVIKNQEEQIESMVDMLADQIPGKNIQFSINASNQASLNRVSNGPFSQVNALIILINPYTLDNLNFSDIDIDIQMHSNDSVTIDGKTYKTHEIHPGIYVFGITEEMRSKSNEV